jgi:adenylate cyclase
MATQDFKRKLTAILSADVKGYSRLMGEDDQATVRTIKAYREVITEVVQKHRGRVVDSPGDNILAEFASVIDAVSSAVEIQEELKIRNAELPEDRRMEFRLGVNLGDVIHEEERIYGDGVNVAARVESLADPGGICVSGTVFDQIESKLPLGYEFLGEQSVKNISKPVRIYKALLDPEAVGKVIGEKKVEPRRGLKVALAVVTVLLLMVGGLLIWRTAFPPVQVASLEKMAFPLPDRPSIAVLPFDNLSEDPKQEYFSDGLTEEIISALSRVPKLFVIARNSTFTYKGKPVKVQQVSEELGVRYVLEGSVRKSGDKIRVTAQLIDALNGSHLWAERYDRNLSDIFSLQDEITKQIITAMQVKLTEGEQFRAAARGTNNLEAYLKCLQSKEYLLKLNPESNALGKQLAEEAIALDPEYAFAYRELSAAHMMDVWFRSSKSPKESMAKAMELVKKAIALDDAFAEAHGWLGFLYSMTKQYDKGIAQAEKAVALNPNSADSHYRLGKTLSLASRWEESIPEYKKALRLNPIPPNMYLWSLGQSHWGTGQYEEAIPWGEKAVRQEPNSLLARVWMAVIYVSSGREEEARAEAAEVLRINPKFSVKKYEKRATFRKKADNERFIDALRKAGLPNKPPLALPDKPSIAVLAFDNMSADPKQEYLADGISENIISALSKISKLFVIARHSTFTYKGKPVKVQQISRELGVRYVLEGSVQKAGDRLRVTAQLVDATTGNHLWSERYDRNLKDIFALQDEIALKILEALQVELTHGEQARVWAGGTDNLEAYLKLLQAHENIYQMNIESNARARQLAEEAIALDPKYASAYQFLGRTHVMDVLYGSSKSPRDSLAKGLKLTQKALALDDSSADAHSWLGFVYTMMRQHDKGITEAERAVALNPNFADAYNRLGLVLRFTGRPEEAIPALKKAIRLNPFPPGVYFYNLATAYAFTGQCTEAIPAGEKALQRESHNLLTHITTTVIYSMCGREEKARETAAGVLRINPNFSCDYFATKLPYKNKADLDLYIGALRKAGLK